MKLNKTASPENKVQRNPLHKRIRAISTALTIVVIVGILLLNVMVSALADRYPISFDMSSDKVFTLSDESKKIAKSVEKDVEVILFADPEELFVMYAQEFYSYYGINLSNQLERLGREVYTALAQLKSNSGEKITYTTIIPDQEPDKYAKYEQYNMGENNVLFLSGDRYRKASLDTMFDWAVGSTAITSNVEKILVSNIYALLGENDRIIQVLTGHEEDAEAIANLKRIYALNGYMTEELQITGAADFNENAEVLLIAAPAKDYSDTEIQRITTWLHNDSKLNRHLMVFLNPTASCPNLFEMLKVEYHIEVTDQLISETDTNRYYSDGQKLDFTLIAADVPGNEYTTNAAGTATILTPMARRLKCDLKSAADNNELAELGIPLVTHPTSAQVVTIGGTGEPTTLKEDEYPLSSAIAYTFEFADNNTGLQATTTVTVFGSVAMAHKVHTQNYSTKNEELLLDVLHNVSGYQTDIVISDKIIDKDQADFTAGAQMVLGIWVFTVGLPLLVLIICLIVFLRRRSL